jgi:DNA-binding CsgD family transcriptional regulator
VEALAGYGVPETEIAGMLGIDPKTYRTLIPGVFAKFG